MDYFKEFVIPFGGLKPGKHRFDFKIDDSFFAHFEYAEIKKGQILVWIDLEKEENLVMLHFHFQGTVEIPCDRCFEFFTFPVKGDNRLILKFGSGFYEENEEVQIIPVGETHIDASPFIYEYIHLLLPIRRVHPDDESGESMCNKDVLDRLNAPAKQSFPDPRWDALNKLRDIQ
jgi:uncharacterized metal-binding protein YceD (DUF177 family)